MTLEERLSWLEKSIEELTVRLADNEAQLHSLDFDVDDLQDETKALRRDMESAKVVLEHLVNKVGP